MATVSPPAASPRREAPRAAAEEEDVEAGVAKLLREKREREERERKRKEESAERKARHAVAVAELKPPKATTGGLRGIASRFFSSVGAPGAESPPKRGREGVEGDDAGSEEEDEVEEDDDVAAQAAPEPAPEPVLLVRHPPAAAPRVAPRAASPSVVLSPDDVENARAAEDLASLRERSPIPELDGRVWLDTRDGKHDYLVFDDETNTWVKDPLGKSVSALTSDKEFTDRERALPHVSRALTTGTELHRIVEEYYNGKRLPVVKNLTLDTVRPGGGVEFHGNLSEAFQKLQRDWVVAPGDISPLESLSFAVLCFGELVALEPLLRRRNVWRTELSMAFTDVVGGKKVTILAGQTDAVFAIPGAEGNEAFFAWTKGQGQRPHPRRVAIVDWKTKDVPKNSQTGYSEFYLETEEGRKYTKQTHLYKALMEALLVRRGIVVEQLYVAMVPKDFRRVQRRAVLLKTWDSSQYGAAETHRAIVDALIEEREAELLLKVAPPRGSGAGALPFQVIPIDYGMGGRFRR